MRNEIITARQKELLSIIYEYIENEGYPPTFEEMRKRLNVSSNQSVIDLLVKLERKQIIKRNMSVARSIAILPVGYEILGKPLLAPFLGATHAGLPISALEREGEWLPVSKDVAQFNSEIFLLKVSGDSMINAGIDDGDIVLVKSAKEFISNDIVLADVDGETMIKRFISQEKPPYLYLKPENPNLSIIYFDEKVTLKGKVIFVLKHERWLKVS